jgi:hypothetical protein
MEERQLRILSMTTVVEAAPRYSESYNDSRELGYNVAENETLGNGERNAHIETETGDEEKQSPDNQVNNPEKTDDKIAMFSKQKDLWRVLGKALTI